MNILHTEASTGWGGQDIRVLTECREMSARGHRVVLACAPGCPLWEAAKKENEKSGFALEPIIFGRKINARSVRAVRRLIQKYQIEIVNTHSSADGWSGAVAGKSSGAKVVRTRHLSNPLRPNRANYFLYSKLTDFVVTTGEQLKEKLVEINKLDASRIGSVPTGVDLKRFDRDSCNRDAFRAEIGLEANEFLWTIVAIVRRMKGHAVLVEAAALLKDTNAHFAVVGGTTGPSPLPEQLETRAKELGLESRFHFVGMREDIPQILAASDGFVLPSLWGEGVPQSIAQAQNMMLPVVSTDVGSIPELVKNEETGLLVAPDNAEELAVAMRRIMTDTNLSQTLAHNGAELVRSHYSQDAMIARMETIYQKVLA
ncbi:MAG TPA: glycosyltransferase family 4 protein [Abditibacteriaceae bacterium]|jgi:glycosyltransferase involved in cell wall biosynthesis